MRYQARVGYSTGLIILFLDQGYMRKGYTHLEERCCEVLLVGIAEPLWRRMY
jgi:hypothetical protein